MSGKIKKLIKKIIPRFLISWYHLGMAYFAAFIYGFPAKKMVIIGVVGTRGKTTTANFLWAGLTAAGCKTGLTGTANIRIGKKEMMNQFHMTMPGRFALQKILHQMEKEGCKFAVVETPSEGVEQWRHKGIDYDVAVLTTLYPEYLAAHQWSYEQCKKMHLKIFSELENQKRKRISGQSVPKIIVINNDSQDREMFLQCSADKFITYAIKSPADFMVENIQSRSNGVSFTVEKDLYELKILGEFNVYNALAALSALVALGIDKKAIKEGLAQLQSIPGRMEKINKGQNFLVLVDYAHDAVSIGALLTAAQNMKEERSNKIIILLGAEGGGRDKKKRPVMGELVAKKADYVVVSNVDPYDDEPAEIIEDIANATEKFGKIRGTDLFAIEDRKEGIKKALSLAKKGDVVLITGKGAEQSMVLKNGSIKWDDREVVGELLDLEK